MTQEYIESLLTSQAESIGLKGIVNESMIKLLAYALYINNSTINSKLVNNIFPSATTLNARIMHASSLLYSVDRGTNTRVTYSNLVPTRTHTYKYLDPAFQYNGNYYYFNKKISVEKDKNVTGLEYIVSDKALVTREISTTSRYQYLDVMDTNISESVRILGVDSDDNTTELKYTNDAYSFLTSGILKDSGFEYTYRLLVITIPNYGIRIIKRCSDEWTYPKFRVKYLIYSEVKPDLELLRSLGDFKYIEKSPATVDGKSDTKYTLDTFLPRLEDFEVIYNNAITTFLSRNQIGSETDIKSVICNTRDLNDQYITVYNLKYPEKVWVRIGNNPNESSGTDRVLDPIKNRLRSMSELVKDIEVVGMQPRELVLSLIIDGNSRTLYELNNEFRNYWRTCRVLNISTIISTITKADPNITSVYCKSATSGGITINPADYLDAPLVIDEGQYFEITLSAATR